MKNCEPEPGNFELVPDDLDEQTSSTATPRPKTTKVKKPASSVTHRQAKLEFLKTDHAHCMAPGLIRSLQDGDRKRYKLDITYTLPNGDRYEIKGAEPLCGLDLKVFYGLVAMGMKDGKKLGPNPKSERGARLRSVILLEGDAANQKVMVVEDSYHRLAIEIGYSDVANANRLRESVERWWQTSMVHIDKKNKKRTGYHFIETFSSDESTKTGKLCVSLNPLVTSAILGEADRYVRIRMDEIRALQSDSSIIMHSKFCATIRPGASHDYMMETLVNYVWPEVAVSVNTQNYRKKAIKNGLAELEALNWVCTKYPGGRKYNIRRPIDESDSKDDAAENLSLQ